MAQPQGLHQLHGVLHHRHGEVSARLGVLVQPAQPEAVAGAPIIRRLRHAAGAGTVVAAGEDVEVAHLEGMGAGHLPEAGKGDEEGHDAGEGRRPSSRQGGAESQQPARRLHRAHRRQHRQGREELEEVANAVEVDHRGDQVAHHGRHDAGDEEDGAGIATAQRAQETDEPEPGGDEDRRRRGEEEHL